MTLTVPNRREALAEMRRLLQQTGKLTPEYAARFPADISERQWTAWSQDEQKWRAEHPGQV